MTFAEVQAAVARSQRLVGFTGAGISTESGIPDFRSPDGVWARNRTVLYQEFVASEEDRVEYWRQKVEIWPVMRAAQPNAGHLALVELEKQGKLLGLITQNIEGLHQRSGLSPDKLVELHGTMIEAACLECGQRVSMDECCERVAAGELAPRCRSCSGLLKPATVSFGQSMPVAAMDRAAKLSQTCEIFVAIGSSLVVQPAAGFPLLAKQGGAILIIVNRTETPLDELADLVVNEEIGACLPRLFNIADPV